MLMTKYRFEVELRPDGAYSTVTRASDGAKHTFFNAGHTRKCNMEQFFSSITDELADTYFPKPRNK